MRAVTAAIFSLFLCREGQAQNMLNKAFVDCMRQGYPVIVEPQKGPDSGLYFWRCEGYVGAALFSEMRGRTNEMPVTTGGVVRWSDRGLSCSQDASGTAGCLIAIEVGKDLLEAMK